VSQESIDDRRQPKVRRPVGLCLQRELQQLELGLGRGGFELVLKALRTGIAVTASVSAATSLAVEIAEEVGGTLVGFVREGSPPRVYADDGRLF